MKNFEIGIIGQGFVGNAVYQKFKDFFNVGTYDIDESKANSTEQEVLDSKIVFICLPTPMHRNGKCDTSIVESAIKKCSEIGKAKIAVIKSTITPGTTQELNKKYPGLQIVFNPEFLTERNAVKDYENQTRIIIGGPRPATTELKRVFSKVFPKAKIIKTDPTYAEMVKYVTNTFLATKVSFANEIYQLCQKIGADYDKVIEYATLDERLGQSHWGVPGPDGDFGYGGHCFPKDLAALLYLSNELNVNCNVLRATKNTNDTVRTDRDWELMVGRAISK